MKSVSELSAHWLNREPDTLTAAQQRVLQSSIERSAITRNTNEAVAERATVGDRLADAVARFGGSWGFLLGVVVALALWTLVNTYVLGPQAFDPYPYIFLNLVLSMLAAIQAPIIMMAQNRQSRHDRLDAAHDYEVNLKAEIEIMALHEKLDRVRDEQLAAILHRIEVLARDIRDIQGARTPEPGADRR